MDEAGKTVGNGVLAVQADVTTLAAVDKLYAEVSTKLGTMDVLFVNAGVATFTPLAKTSESLYGSSIPSIDLQVDGGLAQVSHPVVRIVDSITNHIRGKDHE